MKWLRGLVALVCGCHGGAAVAPGEGKAAPVADEAPQHFKNGARGQVGDAAFELQMLPKLMVSGPVPEIEQLQITVTRGGETKALLVTTIEKRAVWGGVEFELGYADVYHDDIELTIRRR
jgi:hypothetical protein